MSPSESDLRAALHAGEPEGNGAVNADDIIWTVKGRQARRRNLALSVAAAVVVVGGIAGGVAALSGGPGTESASGGGSQFASSNGGGAASAPHAAPSSAADGDAGGSNAQGTGVRNSQSIAVKCSPQPERLALPGRGSPGQFGASGPLLSKTPTSYAICIYSTTLSTTSHVQRDKPQSIVVTGVAANQLTTSLENASTTPQSVACPMIRTDRQVTVVMTPITADGTDLKPITASTSVPACNTQITNGTAIRYNWQAPSRLQRELNLTVVGSSYNGDPTDLVPGSVVSTLHIVHGSPVK